MTNPIDHTPTIIEAIEQLDESDIWQLHHALNCIDVLIANDDSNVSALTDALWSMIAEAHPDDPTVVRNN